MKRRDFLKLSLAGGAALAAPALPRLALSAPSFLKLEAVTRTLDINGRAASVFGLHGPDGKPGLRLKAGDRFSVALKNTLAEPTMIHWHGLRPPFRQDGLPDMPMPLLKAGEERLYDFPVGDAGTHWMHAHTLQEQNLLAAPLIVGRATPDDAQEVVILLHDFSFTPAAELLANLKKGMPGMAGMDHAAHAGHDMGAMDLNDIEYDAYLANDRTLNDPEVVRVEKGGRVRLRVINAATSTVFTIDTGSLEATLTAVDGQDVKPLKGRRFPLAMGQRADILLTLPADTSNAFPILALREGTPHRTGVILATAGSRVSKIADKGDATGPVMDFSIERQLRAASPLATRKPDRIINATLTGNMATYDWDFTSDEGFKVRTGERVAVNITNHSMMSHPIHLHGHRFQITAIDGAPLSGALRDTVQIPPHASVSLAFDADNPGMWAFHCHHLYHMASGMMQMLEYEGIV